ncbi:MAG TPA: patatin-like phospholipase family protein [Acidimicrobiales bacterium]|nr:patatin-like phospholipase family protein [Acidimicrobiales bacterium]
MASPKKTAFVLAGGGAKGAFEAGAVSYLVEEEGIVPDVITATSAGAVCAAVLAQARGHEELVERTRELHDDLLAMTKADLLFGKQPWVAALEGTLFGRAIDHWVVESTRPPVPGAPDGSGGARHAVADRGPPPGRSIRLAAQVVRAIPNLGRARRRMRGQTGSLLTLDPLAERLRRGGRGIAPVDPALVARPGLDLRLAVVALGAGVLRYVTENGTIVDGDAVTPVPGPAGGPVSLIEGVIASASVPMIFPPRPLAGDAYVDGGVVENIPVAAAAALGARRIFAVLAVPLDPPPNHYDYSRASAPVVFLRAVGAISFAERQRANLAPQLPDRTELTVIDPVVDVVGPFDVARGLMLLNMDYGWMRGADRCADVAPAARQRAAEATDAIVVARTQAWHREEEIWSEGAAAAGDLAALTRCKRIVRDALSERKELGLPTPHDATRWWSGYEVHEGTRPVSLPPGPFDEAS